MKKYIIMAVSALMLAFTSCTDSEDIEIIEIDDITFEINTEAIYEEFGITEGIKNQMLRDRMYAIGVTSFIYDKNGALVDSMTTYSYNVNAIKHSYESLVKDEYTAVFVQTLVRVDNDFQPLHYRFEGVENLSTLEIKQIYQPYWFAVIGTATQKFTLGDYTIQIRPKAIGAIIDCNFFDFVDSPFVNIGIGTEESYSGYKLDPAIPEENRYSSDLSETAVFYLLGEIKGIDEREEGFDIYVLGNSLKYTFYYQNEELANEGSWKRLSKLENHVTLNAGETTYIGYAYRDANNGTVHAYYGDKNGMEKWYASLNDHIAEKGETTDELVPELYAKWGASVSSVQEAMSDYTMTVGTSGKAILQNDGTYGIGYKGKGKESMISYFFTSETTGLFEADVQYSKEEVTSEEILNYLNNNYTYLAASEGTYMYANKDLTTLILFFEINGVWNIGFIDAEYVNNMSSKVKIPAYRLPQRTRSNKKQNISESFISNSEIVTAVARLNNELKYIERQ